MKRKVLVILSNRVNVRQKPRFFELDCDDKGTLLKERALRTRPKEPRYDEVWVNDEGRDAVALCHRFQRQYRHALEKKRPAARAAARRH